MKTENIIRIVQTVLFVAVAAFAISVVVAGHWWVTPPPPPPPPPTVNVQAVGKQVVGLLQGQWNRDPLNEYGITVDADGMTLINTGLNKYDGLTTVHTRSGTQKFLSVDVWADPTGAMFYRMDPESASNLMDAAKKEEPNRCWSGSYCSSS
jgi:hypothetical protein